MVGVIDRFTNIPECDKQQESVITEDYLSYLFEDETKSTPKDSMSKNNGQDSVSTEKRDSIAITYKLYPNPCTTDCKIEFSEEQKGKAYLMDANGKMISIVPFDLSTSVTIDMSNWSVGNYFVLIETPKKNWVEKIIKQQ